MQDRLKFRAYDKLHKKYFKPIYNTQHGQLEELFLDPSGALLLRINDRICHESAIKDRFEIEFCTGWTDKNNKLIYQEDIVKEHPNGHIGLIRFYELSFHLNPAYEPRSLFELMLTNRLEIIGNKWENFNLLNGLNIGDIFTLD